MGKYFSDVVDQAIEDLYYCCDNDKAKAAADVGRRIKGDADRRLFFRTAEMTLHSQGVNRRILPIMRHAEGVY